MRTIWTRQNSVYNFIMIGPNKLPEKQILFLDLVIILHGSIGLFYCYIFPPSSDSFRSEYPELFYLVFIYMWGAVSGPLWKITRYIWLFKYLPRKISKQ